MKIDFAPMVKRFDELAKRERVLIFVATVVLVAGGIFGLVIDPALLRAKTLEKAIAEHETQLSNLRVTHQELMTRMGQDINAGIRGQVSEVEGSLLEIESDIKTLHKTLIPAQAMADVLAGLLKRDAGVTLVSLRNIAPEALDLTGRDKTGAPRRTPATESAATDAGVLYRHGIELEIEGTYFDLLAYVTEIEKQPYRILWSETTLTSQYPKSRLRIKLHTLSLDASWLSV